MFARSRRMGIRTINKVERENRVGGCLSRVAELGGRERKSMLESLGVRVCSWTGSLLDRVEETRPRTKERRWKR